MPPRGSVWDFGRRIWSARRAASRPSFLSVNRPLVILQSDDWGRVGIRDQEGYEAIRANGMQLGQHPYDFYTLETAADVTALAEMLKGHKDSTGRPPCLVMNFMMANLDFDRMRTRDFQEICLLYLSNGLPGRWKRTKLFDAYRQGIAEGIFYPALHGLTHFCRPAVEHALAHDHQRRELLHTLWKSETPFIYWRMPWIGYEYQSFDKQSDGILPFQTQELLIKRTAQEFEKFFCRPPFSACAPGYRANQDTIRAWSKNGVRVAQNGSGSPLPPHFVEQDVLTLSRTIDVEPASRDFSIEKYIQLADRTLARGVPAIISVHSINFHSTLKDFRTPTLKVLDELLSALEHKYPDLLYVHDEDMYQIVSSGKLESRDGLVALNVIQREVSRSGLVTG